MQAKLFHSSPRVPRPKETRIARLLLPIFLIALVFLLVSSKAEAHGSGYLQIQAASMGRYVAHVWVAPGVLRTGDVHVDTAVFDLAGNPARGVLVSVAFVPLESEALPLTSLAGAPDPEYPYPRGAALRIDTPGKYRLEVAVSDQEGEAGITSADVEVMTIGWPIKAAIALIFLGSAASGAWIVFQTRAFWVQRTVVSRLQARHFSRHLYRHGLKRHGFARGGTSNMSLTQGTQHQSQHQGLMQRLNGVYHAPALWIYMLIIVAHWLEHVLQIYQIYALGWSPDKAGGILGVIYPQLVESETLHFVYDFIQWAGIIILLAGFREPRARLFWTVAMIFQTWHYIEHVLLMGQYLTGYYLFGAPQQISILQLWFPRAELHFTYNLLVFIPMVIAVHFYLQPKLAQLAAAQRVEIAADETSGR